MISSAVTGGVEKIHSSFKKTISKNDFQKLFNLVKCDFSNNENIQIKDLYIYAKEGTSEFNYLVNLSLIKDYIKHYHSIPYVGDEIYKKYKSGYIQKEGGEFDGELTMYNPFSGKVEQFFLGQDVFEQNRLEYIQKGISKRVLRSFRGKEDKVELSSKIFDYYKEIEEIEEKFLQIKESISQGNGYNFSDDQENQNIFHMIDDLGKIILNLSSYTFFPGSKEKYKKVAKDIDKIKQDFLDIVFVLTGEQIDREIIKNRFIYDIEKIFKDSNKIKKLIYPKYYSKYVS